MTRIWPILTSRLKKDHLPSYLQTVDIWADPDSHLASAIGAFHQSCVVTIRINPVRRLLGKPITYIFPQATNFPKQIVIHDSNDVADIHRDVSPHFEADEKRDIHLATASARRLLEQHQRREYLLSFIAEECLFPSDRKRYLGYMEARMVEVFGTRDLAAALPEGGSFDINTRIRSFATAGECQQIEECPGFLMHADASDIVLPLCAPGLAGLSSHELVQRRVDLPRQTHLILTAMSLGEAYNLQPLIQ